MIIECSLGGIIIILKITVCFGWHCSPKHSKNGSDRWHESISLNLLENNPHIHISSSSPYCIKVDPIPNLHASVTTSSGLQKSFRSYSMSSKYVQFFIGSMLASCQFSCFWLVLKTFDLQSTVFKVKEFAQSIVW